MAKSTEEKDQEAAQAQSQADQENAPGLEQDALEPQDNPTMAAAGLNMAAEDPSNTYDHGVQGNVNTAVPASADTSGSYQDAHEKGYYGYAPGPTEPYTFEAAAKTVKKQGATANAVVNESKPEE